MRTFPPQTEDLLARFGRDLETTIDLLPRNRGRYLYKVRGFLTARCPKGISDLTKPRLLGRHSGMVESGYSSSHLQVRHFAVKRLLAYLVDIEENGRAALLLAALERIEVPRDTRRKPKPPPMEDSLAQRLLDAARKRPGLGPRDRALLHFIWTTGVRVSEVAMVSLDGLHLEERSATVRGKGDKERLVFFDDPC